LHCRKIFIKYNKNKRK